MYREFKLGKSWIHIGYGKRIAFGFSVDMFSISIDFLCFWVGVEW